MFWSCGTQFSGRVGEKATPVARPTLPSSNRRCRFPASGSPESSRLRHAQCPIDGSAQARQMLKPLFSLRTTVWPLAAPLQMLDQTVPNVAFDLTVGTRGIPEGKVVHPSFQVPIQLSNQDRDRLMALTTIRHLMQLLPFPLDRLSRREYVQVFSIASFQITVIPERITQKVKTRALLPQVHHPRLFPIDLQLEFSFQPRFDELDGFRSHLFR